MRGEACRRLWDELFRGGRHLDSALAKWPGEERARLAPLAQAILRRPRSLARAVGLALSGGEPWSLAVEARARWGALPALAERLARLPELPAGPGEVDDYPPELSAAWTRAFGEAVTRSLVARLGEAPAQSLRLARGEDAEELQGALGGGGHPGVAPRSLVFPGFRPLTRSAAHAAGRFELQDESAQLVALLALWPERYAPWLAPSPAAAWPGAAPPLPPPPRRAPVVIDACAGAGGKTLALADALAGRGRVFAYDVSARRLAALRRRAERAGLHNVQAQRVEGEEGAQLRRFAGTADVLLVDAPCSGLGVLRRNPDAKWRERTTPEMLAALQLRLLGAYLPLLRRGGRLIYAVCTFLPEETTEVERALLAARPELAPQAHGYLGPSATADGFFASVFTLGEEPR